MKRKNSSHPDATDATELSMLVSLSMALVNFSRSSESVSAKWKSEINIMKTCFSELTSPFEVLFHIQVVKYPKVLYTY